MPKQVLDIIWNISLICPWDCEFCCTDAVHVTSNNNQIIAREHSLQSLNIVENSLKEIFKKQYPNIPPTKYDLALIDRQALKKEPSYDQKLKILKHLSNFDVKIDFAGGDPLACHENYLIIKEASRLFGKDSISITSTGVFVKKYGTEDIASIIGEYEFTYDEPFDVIQSSRPKGYNFSNLKTAKNFSELGIRTKAQLPIHSGNITKRNIASIYKNLCDANIDELLLMRTFPVGRGKKYLENHTITKAETLNMIAEFKNLETQGKTRIRLQCALKHLHDSKNNKNPCDLMHESFGINFRGELMISAWGNDEKGLPISPDFVLGDLCKNTFEEIAQTETFKKYKVRLDENHGHCKIFSYMASDVKSAENLFKKIDPLYI
jgi:MoaA/NifB/PqqE/SkfB family radical SAM enzyme